MHIFQFLQYKLMFSSVKLETKRFHVTSQVSIYLEERGSKVICTVQLLTSHTQRELHPPQ